MRRLAGYILFHKRHPSRCRRRQAADEIQRRGLAGTVRSDQTADLAPLNIHRNRVDSHDATESAGEPVEGEERGHWRLQRGVATASACGSDCSARPIAAATAI